MKRKTLRRVGQAMMVLAVLALLALLSACAHPDIKPIGSVRLNYAFPFSTDYWQHSDRSWQCEQPQVEVEGGWEHRSGWGWGGYHESMVLCGNWNQKPEIYENGLYLKYSRGGWREGQ